VTLTDAQRRTRYPQLVDQALAGELAGSSAGGEQPKFPVVIVDAEGSAHVLVKFSEPLETPTGRRWADLLLAEHHALAVIAESGLPAARSRVLEVGGRLFLEVRRFDRIGARGRRGLISLAAADDEFVGQRRHWLDSAHALLRRRLLSAEDVERIAWLQAFGGLIGNTDMHFGNLSLFYDGAAPAALAPAYDMLPMCYAPQRGELRTPSFTPAPPPPRGIASARRARESAQRYWMVVAEDQRVSAGFREIARANAVTVAALHW
jgi:serine/threonine protein kinase HipA of HipAB toxin-antitoxin module